MFNVCYCGKQAGYPHAPDCPYPLFRGTDEDVARWENTRRALLDARAEAAATQDVELVTGGRLTLAGAAYLLGEAV
jgi:hypothetical protein